jgi:hypothetical protein
MSHVDLHIHSFYSDGTSAPQELVSLAADAGLAAFSLCDHDTVEGIAPCLEAAAASGIEVIPGIELSAEYGQREVHILGYFIDPSHVGLLEQLAVLKSNRIERVHKIIAKLNELGVHLEADQVFALSPRGVVGRLHIARALVKKKHVGTTYEAFGRYLGDSAPAFVLGFKITPARAIALVREAGGVPVLAHPYSIRDNAYIEELVGAGLAGIETYYPEHSQSMSNFYRDIALQHGLIMTGGSDFHGGAKPDVKMGCVQVPYEVVAQLKAARREAA